MLGKQSANGGEVVLEVGREETSVEAKGSSSKGLECSAPVPASTIGFSKSAEISTSSSSETLTKRKSLSRSVYSKPKSRFNEPWSIMHEDASLDQAAANSPKDEDDVKIDNKVKLGRGKHRKVKKKILIEWIVFMCILGCLVASLTVQKLVNLLVGGLEIWRWCVLVGVIFFGMLVTNWVMHFLVFVIERNFLFRKKVLYFVYGIKKNVQVFMWWVLVLLVWLLLFNRGIERSKRSTKIMYYVTWTLVSLVIGAFLLLLKTLLVKILVANLHVYSYFDRIQESIFHQYILQTLSGPPIVQDCENDDEQKLERESKGSPNEWTSPRREERGPLIVEDCENKKETIDMEKLQKIKHERFTDLTMQTLVKRSLDLVDAVIRQDKIQDGGEDDEGTITSEMEATAAAYHIFSNVAQPGNKYIEEEDLMRFMVKEEVGRVFSMFEGAETGHIDRKSLTDWVVNAYIGRKRLSDSLIDTKKAGKQLNKLMTGIVLVIIIVVWLLLVQIATTKVLVVFSSQLVLAAFIFGDTCKNIFEAIVFIFLLHPFAVGDRCVVDGELLMVEKMSIFTTVFLKLNNEKVYYPNSVLSTKPISNCDRGSGKGDFVEFSIALTPEEKIGQLKEKIKGYLESNPQYWYVHHHTAVIEIENGSKLKMALYFNHSVNFQEFGEKNKRKAELILRLMEIFEELNIKYSLLSQ